MEQAKVLRDKAKHCIRLSHGLSNPSDIAIFEALADEWNQAAEAREKAAEAVAP
jgi:hypothetical protein